MSINFIIFYLYYFIIIYPLNQSLPTESRPFGFEDEDLGWVGEKKLKVAYLFLSVLILVKLI